MNFYRFYPYDQAKNVWLTFSEQSGPPYVTVKPRYARFICPKCCTLDHDAIFRQGFDEGLKLRAKGNVLGTSEGFYCFDEKAKNTLESRGSRGLTFKELLGTPWFVVNVTCRVWADEAAYQHSKRACDRCGRPKEVLGEIVFLSQIRTPEQPGSFFSTTFDRCGSMNGDRDLFVTEDIVSWLKEAGVKGGLFERLLSLEEEEQFKEATAKRKPFKWPKDFQVAL